MCQFAHWRIEQKWMSVRCPYLSIPFQIPHSASRAYSSCYFPERYHHLYLALLADCYHHLLHRVRLDEDHCFHLLDRLLPTLDFFRYHHLTVLVGCCRVPTHSQLPIGLRPNRAPVHPLDSGPILPLIDLLLTLAIVPLRLLRRSRLLPLRLRRPHRLRQPVPTLLLRSLSQPHVVRPHRWRQRRI